MGKCVFCGRSAGLFSSRHEACEREHDSGWATIVGDFRLAAAGKCESPTLQQRVSATADSSHIPPERLKDALAEGWSLALDDHLNNGGMDVDDEHRLVAFSERFGLARELLDSSGAWTRMAKAALIRDLLNGFLPQPAGDGDSLPFTLTADERLVWPFSDVKYLEGQPLATGGGYHGARVETARGQYYRPSGFGGNPVRTAERALVESGVLAVTTRHIYFACRERRLRIRHDQVISLTPYTDGVAIQHDADSAKPHVFVTGDGWFTYNLLANIGSVTGW